MKQIPGIVLGLMKLGTLDNRRVLRMYPGTIYFDLTAIVVGSCSVFLIFDDRYDTYDI